MTVSNAASIHARLLNRARQRGEDFNLVLTRFAIERFLYRLSQLPEGNAFLLKGALANCMTVTNAKQAGAAPGCPRCENNGAMA